MPPSHGDPLEELAATIAAVKKKTVPPMKTVKKSPPGLQSLIDLANAVKQGEYSNDLLVAALAMNPPSVVASYLPPDGVFQYCSSCLVPVFSKRTKKAYGGKQYVCEFCAEQWYVYCEECRSLILKDDNVMHVHVPDLIDFMGKNELYHYKANPLEHLPARFYATPEEEARLYPKYPTRPLFHNDIRFFGIEVELERRTDRPLPPDLIAKSVAAFPKNAVLAKSDGSLSKSATDPNTNGSNGWELCSMPGSLDYHRSEAAGWLRFFEVVRPFVQDRPNTTGLHFHVNLDSITPLILARISAFVNSDKNSELLISVADRDFNVPSPTPPFKVYSPAGGLRNEADMRSQMREIVSMRKHEQGCPCHVSKKPTRMYYYDKAAGFRFDSHMRPLIIRIDEDPTLSYRCSCKPGSYHYKDHYAGLNLKTNKETFEFRLFRFSMNHQHFFAALEFVDALIVYCSQSSLSGLTAEEFLRWYNSSQRRLYPSLTQWLVDRNWIPSRRRRD